jgi:hypothetical protein
VTLRAVVVGTLSLEQRALAVRIASACALVATYLLTWDLWHARVSPPNLPVVPFLAGLSFSIVLPLAALVAVKFPRAGAIVHSGLFIVAILGDQIRLQPEFVSLGILLLGAAFPRSGLEVARWHLVTLWIWAGLNKALSAGWPTAGVQFVVGTVGLAIFSPIAMIVVPVIESGVGFLGLNRRWWPAVRVLAPVMHLQILLTLVIAHYNTAVWPWNVGIAIAAPFLFLPDREGDASMRPRARHSSSNPRTRGRVVTALAILMAVYPAGFYVGISETYLSHNLYTANTATAAICPPPDGVGDVKCSGALFSSSMTAINVPVPPERRIYTGWFDRACRPGESLRLLGIWTHLADRTVEFIPCGRRS